MNEECVLHRAGLPAKDSALSQKVPPTRRAPPDAVKSSTDRFPEKTGAPANATPAARQTQTPNRWNQSPAPLASALLHKSKPELPPRTPRSVPTRQHQTMPGGCESEIAS